MTEQERKAEQWKADLTAVLESPAGQRMVSRLVARCGLLVQPFAAGAPDGTAYNCGRRDPALWLLGEIRELCPARMKDLDLGG
jgi:hypothetical protein